MALTAAELMAKMQNDPQGRAVRDAQDERMAARRREYDEAAAGLLSDLRAAGVEADSLVEVRAERDQRAVPVLIAWLDRTDYLGLIEDLTKTLGSSWTGREAVEALFALYERTDPGTDGGGKIRWAAAAALEHVVTEADFDRLLKLATEPSSDTDRTRLIAALGTMKVHRDQVVPVLTALLEESPATGAAIEALGKLGDRNQLPLIEPFTRDSDEWLREQAKLAVKRLRK